MRCGRETRVGAACVVAVMASACLGPAGARTKVVECGIQSPHPGDPSPTPDGIKVVRLCWEGPDYALPVFVGSGKEASAAVDVVLERTAEVTAMSFFVGANSALALRRLRDAGFLYFAGEVRADTDLARFKGNSKAAWVLGNLRNSTRISTIPKLWDRRNARDLEAVATRFERWDCHASPDHAPGWEAHGPPGADDCDEAKAFRVQALRKMLEVPDDPACADADRYILEYLRKNEPRDEKIQAVMMTAGKCQLRYQRELTR